MFADSLQPSQPFLRGGMTTEVERGLIWRIHPKDERGDSGGGSRGRSGGENDREGGGVDKQISS